MKRLILIFVYFYLATGTNFQYDLRFFKQKVDHFGYCNQDYFLQRYLINFDHYSESNGTVFFYTGNEGSIEVFANNTGFMWENAETFNALLVFAEHRYYGLSLPYGNESLKDNQRRGYLTSEQALADFAVLISYLKSTVPGGKHAPVIAFGGSYGGMLSAWMRIKYPHLVNGALASSAPILQFQGLTSCGKYFEVVTNDFMQASSGCVESIRKSWQLIRTLGSKETGRQYLNKVFRLCKPLNYSDIDDLVAWLSSTWEFLAMTNYPYPTNFLQPLPAYPVNVACKNLQNASVSPPELIRNIFKAASVFLNYTGNVKCFDLSEAGGTSLGIKQWDYQECTEMIQSTCQTGTTDMFEPRQWNFTAYSRQCYSKWNIKPDPYKTLIMYGGRNITAASNIIFSNGKWDPFYPGGVLESLSKTLIAIVIENATHHLDLRSSNPADPPSVTVARQKILHLISKWLAELQ